MASGQPSQEVLVSGAGRPSEQTFQVVNKKPSQAGGIAIFYAKEREEQKGCFFVGRKGVSSKDHTQSGTRPHSHRGEDSSHSDLTRKKTHSGHSKV